MARKGGGAPPEPERPKLTVPRNEAMALLWRQIEAGETLLSSMNTATSPSDAQAKGQQWEKYTAELLRKMLTITELADEFVGLPMNIWDRDPRRHFQNVIRNITGALERLRSIHTRLELFDEAPGVSLATGAQPVRAVEVNTKDVFVVHGHDEAAKATVAPFLEKLKLNAIVLHEQPDKGRTIIEKFLDHSKVGYAVVLLTPDDIGGPKNSRDFTTLQPRARQNVILELGYFIGALGRDRVCALKTAGVELPSDLAGVLYIELDSSDAWRLQFAKEMKHAGLDVDLNLAI